MAKVKKVAAVVAATVLSASLVAGLAACGDKGSTAVIQGTPGEYTYRTATAALADNWNTHTYTSETSNDILGYTEDALYTFDYNDDMTSYEIVPSMAVGDPQDVTNVYAGDSQWKIGADESWRAIRITLRSDLKFENGDPITAQTFVESMELLLDPKAANYRADTYYSGQFNIFNAEEYAKGGTYAYSNMVSAAFGAEEYIDPEDFTDGTKGYQYTTERGLEDIVINVNDGGNWGDGLGAYFNAGYFDGDSEEDMAAEGYAFDGDRVPGLKDLIAAADEDGYVQLNDARLKVVQNAIAVLHGFVDAEAYAKDCEEKNNFKGDLNYAYVEWEEMAFYGSIWAEMDFSSVGYKAVDNTTLDIILEQPLEGFYLMYNLCSSMSLVHPETYRECINSAQGAYTNNYGTSKETYVGFGPYKIETYVMNNVVTFEKNDNWYGYGLRENAGRYQTTNISIRQITNESTRLNEFLAGNLDSYGLSATDFATYGSSPYAVYTEGESTFFVALNPDMDGLGAAENPSQGIYKRVLTLQSFRMALSLSIDRQSYISNLDPASQPALGLFGNLIISDPDSATAYRDTQQAKEVLVEFWGLADEVGEGKTYATLDEAIEAIEASGGVDVAQAKQMFSQAYEEAVDQGLLPSGDDWTVEIIIGKPAEADYYNNGYDFLQRTWTQAVEGTPFEGHLSFRQSEVLGATSFAEALQENRVDVLFGVGWTGSALDPYNLMQAYVDPNYQYDPGWNTTQAMVDVPYTDEDGTEITLRASAYAWGVQALRGTPIAAGVVGEDGNVISGETREVVADSTADPEFRLDVLSALEHAVLMQYDMIPVSLESSVALRSMRVNFATEDYIYGIGRGGVKYMTYGYDDAQWTDFVNANGGRLNYVGE